MLVVYKSLHAMHFTSNVTFPSCYVITARGRSTAVTCGGRTVWIINEVIGKQQK